MENWLIERYLNSPLSLPGPVLQALLNAYVLGLFFRARLTGKWDTSEVPQTAEIAERSSDLMRLHYDMPLALFESFLGPSMKYSMACWEKGAPTLEEAQREMMEDVCEKARLSDGQTILDIGCGFGSFPAHVLSRYPHARVFGVTLSHTQANYMRACQGQPGHPLNSDRFHLIEADFNQLELTHRFDRIVSLGVFEHISNLDMALEKIRSMIRKDGLLFLHFIVFRPFKQAPFQAMRNGCIDQYIFPGGRVWSEAELPRHQEVFRLAQQWFLNGMNYYRTLKAWQDNLYKNRDNMRKQSLLGEKKLKMWDLYLKASAAGFQLFKGRLMGNGQYLLVPR